MNKAYLFFLATFISVISVQLVLAEPLQISGGVVAVTENATEGINFQDNSTADVADSVSIGSHVTTDNAVNNTSMGTLILRGANTVSGNLGDWGNQRGLATLDLYGGSNSIGGNLNVVDNVNVRTLSGVSRIGGTSGGGLLNGGFLKGSVHFFTDTALLVGAIGDGNAVGNVTNDSGVNNTGYLVVGAYSPFPGFVSSGVSGQIGAAGAALHMVYAGADAVTTTFSGDIFAQTVEIQGAGISEIDDGHQVTGAVTASTDGSGTLKFLGDGAVNGQIGTGGDGGKELGAVIAGADGKTVTFSDDIYATTLNVSGTGDVVLDGTLNGDLDFDGDGTATVADDETVTGVVTNSTGENSRGTLTLAGTSTIASQVGADGAALKVVNAGEDGEVATFSSDVYATTMNVTGTGSVALNGTLTGALDFDADGVATVADDETVTGAVTNSAGANSRGMLTLAGTSTVANQVGANGAALKVVNAGANGEVATFSSDVYATTMNVAGTGSLALNGTLTGALDFDADGTATVADDETVTGAVTNSTGVNSRGTLTLAGTSTVANQVGANGAALKVVNAGANGEAATFSSDVYATTMNVAGTGSLALNGTLTGALDFDADGTATVADDETVTGAVTNSTGVNSRGTLTLAGTSTVANQVGANGAALKVVNAGANGEAATFSSDVYATTMNVAGTGSLALNGTLIGALDFDADGVATVADDETVTGAVTNSTGVNSRGTLTLAGTSTVANQVGANGAALKVVNAGEDGEVATFSSDVYATTMNVAGMGNILLEGTLTGALDFDADGVATVADDETVTGAVTNSAGANSRGTLTLAGTSTIASQVGADGAALKVVNAGANGEAATFSSDVYATTMNVTGTGSVALNGTMNGALHYVGNGVVVLADGEDVAGAVSAQSDGVGTLNLVGGHALSSAIGTAGNNKLAAINISQGESVMGADLAATLIKVTNGGTLSLTADRVIAEGNLELDDTGVDGILDLGVNELVLTSGFLTADSGATLRLAIDSATSYGHITQTAGNSVIASGATVDISVGGYIPSGTVFTIVNGNAGTGVTAGVLVVDDSATLDFTASGTSGADLIVTASTNYVPVSSDNSAAAGASDALEGIEQAGAGDDMTLVLGELQGLPTPEDVTDAVEQLTPVVNSAVIVETGNLLSGGVQNVGDHLAALRAESTGVSAGDQPSEKAFWAKTFGMLADQSSRSGLDGYKAWSAGTLLGLDLGRTDMLTWGLAVGYAMSRVDSDRANINDTVIDNYPLIMYVGFDQDGPWYVDTSLSFAWNEYEGARQIDIGAIHRQANADYDGQQYAASMEAGYRIALSPKTALTPKVFTEYSRLIIGKYWEEGAGDLNLDVAAQNYEQLRPGVGLSLTGEWKAGAMAVVPEVHTRWMYDILADQMQTTATFNGAGAAFESMGMKPAKQSWSVGTDWEFQLSDNKTITLTYDLECKQDYLAHYGSATFKVDF